MIMKASSEYYKIFVDLTDTTSSHPEHNYLFNRHKWSRCIINETFIWIIHEFEIISTSITSKFIQ